MIVYLNKSFLPDQEATLSIADGGFLHGDGVFTTLRLYQGRAPDLPGHWQRLLEQGQVLDLNLPMTWETARNAVTELVALNHLENVDARLRITLSRGAALGQPPTLLMVPEDLPRTLDHDQRQGIAALTLGPNYLRTWRPDLKSLNYLPSLMALREAHKQGCGEAIILTENRQLVEGAVSNVFLVHDGKLLTPAACGQLLAGRTRSHLLALAISLGLGVHETELDRDDLENAAEVFVCNSVREVVPVVSLDGRPVSGGQPGTITRRLARSYRRLMETP